jgi:hypothetical protein
MQASNSMSLCVVESCIETSHTFDAAFQSALSACPKYQDKTGVAMWIAFRKPCE